MVSFLTTTIQIKDDLDIIIAKTQTVINLLKEVQKLSDALNTTSTEDITAEILDGIKEGIQRTRYTY